MSESKEYCTFHVEGMFFGVEVQPPVEPAMQDRNHPNE